MSQHDPFSGSQDVEMSDASPFGHPGLLHYADPEDMDDLIGMATTYDHPSGTGSSRGGGGRHKPDVPVLHEKFANKFNDLFDEELLGHDGRLAKSGAAVGSSSASSSAASQGAGQQAQSQSQSQTPAAGSAAAAQQESS